MVENNNEWKIMAQLPPNDQNQNHFECFINGKNFMHYDFHPLIQERNKTLGGKIIFNDIEFLKYSASFQWNSQTAANRILAKLGRD